VSPRTAALQTGPGAFEGEMAGEDVDGIEFEGIEHGAHLRRRSVCAGREILDLRDAEKEFKEAGGEKRFGFLVGRGL